MTKVELNSYRLTSFEEPSDEMLSAIMKEVAEDVRRENAEVKKQFMKRLHAQAKANRQHYGL